MDTRIDWNDMLAMDCSQYLLMDIELHQMSLAIGALRQITRDGDLMVFETAVPQCRFNFRNGTHTHVPQPLRVMVHCRYSPPRRCPDGSIRLSAGFGMEQSLVPRGLSLLVHQYFPHAAPPVVQAANIR